MCDWKVTEIVEILVKDAALLKDKRRFAHSINIPVNCLTDLEHRYEQNSDSYAFFCDVLEKWKSVTGNGATISLLANILRENEFAASAEKLTSFNTCISATVFGAKNPVFNFVGREKELNQLNELFIEKKSFLVLISAKGGKGKTELCRRFIQQLPKDNGTLVTWLTGDDAQQFQQSLSEISQEMNVQTTDSTKKPLSVEKIIQNIPHKRKSKWLVIMDNVDVIFPDFYPAVDSFLRNGAFIVVTSRMSYIESGKPIFLKDLEDEDALEFVRSSLSVNEVPCFELTVDLCKCLKNYPLALLKAVAYIKYKQQLEDNSYGIEEYLKELDLSTFLALDHKNLSNEYDHIVLKVFELTLNKIKSIDAIIRQNQETFFERFKSIFIKNKKDSPQILLLQILSLVQPEGSEIKLLKELFSIFESEELFDSSLSSLKSFSLIVVTNKGEVLIHRVVQQLTEDQMKSEFHSVIGKILENINTEKLDKKEIVQLIQIWKNALPELEIIKKVSNFAERICQRLFELSLYIDLKDFTEIILKQFVPFLGPDHIDTLRIHYWLGLALKHNIEYEEALEKYKMVWAKQINVLGDKHWQTLNSAGEIANVLLRLDRLDESLEWHNWVLKFKEKVYGENHQYTMNTKSSMAMVLNRQGKREKALSIFRQVLEWSEKELGHEHPHTLGTKHKIAFCLYNQKKFVEAKKMFEELLRLRIKILGKDHADTLNTKYWLSVTFHFLGKKEQALKMIKQVLISQEKVLGPNHSQTNITRNRISKWKNPTESDAVDIIANIITDIWTLVS